MPGITDAGALQQRGRVQRTATNNHLTLDLNRKHLPLALAVDAHGLAPGKFNPVHHRAGNDREILALPARVDKGLRGAPTDALTDIALGDMHAFLLEGIGVFDPGPTGLLPGLQKRLVKRAFCRTGFNQHRPFAAAISITSLVVTFRLFEVWQHLGVAPSRISEFLPMVIIPRIAAHPVHPVDRG